MKLQVLTSQWAAEGELFSGGTHDDVKLTRKLAPLVAAAEDAGTVVVEASAVERKMLRGHVQSQADGEKAYDQAHKSGRWRHGQLVTFIASTEDRLAHDDLQRNRPLDEAVAEGVTQARRGQDDVERQALLTKAERTTLEQQLVAAKAELAETEEPT